MQLDVISRIHSLTENLSASHAAAFIGCAALALCFLVTNAKSLPLVYTVRLLPPVWRLLRPRLFPSRKIQKPLIPKPPSSSSLAQAAAARPVLFKYHSSSSRTALAELDINIHKSNSTFFADADISRAELLTRLLSQGLATAGPNSAPVVPLLAAVQCSFKREIGPFQAYDVSSRILAWNDRSLFVITYFLKPGFKLPPDVEVAGGPGAVLRDASLRRAVFAVMLSKYVCKAGRETVAPTVVLEAAGLLVSEGPANKKDYTALLAADDVEKALKSGMQYVCECML
ncbi:hypothetical protein VTI74DRAFT_3723 [Chaetomium olivicolor]